jgi:hypothetical protein
LIEVYYRWRPNLPDEGDNHVLELAVAAGDAPIVTFNRCDFRDRELRFPSIVVQSPAACLKSAPTIAKPKNYYETGRPMRASICGK